MTDSKHPNAYPWLEQLSSQELENLLQQDFSAGEGNSNTDFVMAIMDVLAQRDPQAIEIDDAWETFRAQCIPPQDTDPEAEKTPTVVPFPNDKVPSPPPPRRQHFLFRRFLAVAAMLCVLTCLMVLPAHACGKLPDLIQWSNGTFHFLPRKRSSLLDSPKYQELQEEISARTDLPVLPTWYPEGTEVEQIEISALSDRSFIDVLFRVYDETFTFSITAYDSIPENPSAVYEKNRGTPEDYFQHNIHHFFYTNMELIGVAWWNENVECSILGNVSKDNLKHMIDSIYS